MDVEEKPNPLQLALITQTQPQGELEADEQPIEKVARKRKAPLWMRDYLINYNGATYSSKNTLPTLHRLEKKIKENRSPSLSITNTRKTKDESSSSTSNTRNTKDENLSCQLCQISCSSIVALKQHLEGRQHKAKLEYGKSKMCDVCEIWCSDANALEMHLKGKKHKAKLKRVDDCTNNDGERVLKAPILCELCLVHCMNEESYEMHLKGKKHTTKEELKRQYETRK